MSEKDEGLEMEARYRHAFITEISDVTDDSITNVDVAENIHMSAPVRRLLSNDNFFAPKKQGTVRVNFDARNCLASLTSYSGMELEAIVFACRCWKRRWTR